jgi:hypothetical protein
VPGPRACANGALWYPCLAEQEYATAMWEYATEDNAECRKTERGPQEVDRRLRTVAQARALAAAPWNTL